MKLDALKVQSVINDARSAVKKCDTGLGAFHAAGYARGMIETLNKLGLMSSVEFNRLEREVMIKEADADMADI
ncbi:hypothetical protein [Pseudomonas monteilii]|uniref:hypothetical protein n=1 Tax=Pseudomonas monteilii TaxID=76759 RepID=UPI001CBB31B5|nr:hypothetical protein [Pseudomonas monteilii]MBZ3664929.1 hypothetical protein [Pseudomonas monteilii]MBZ3670274.1 hypothetical protein [Pseudomonas monteilii]